jgi:hypothetical protein
VDLGEEAVKVKMGILNLPCFYSREIPVDTFRMEDGAVVGPSGSIIARWFVLPYSEVKPIGGGVWRTDDPAYRIHPTVFVQPREIERRRWKVAAGGGGRRRNRLSVFNAALMASLRHVLAPPDAAGQLCNVVLNGRAYWLVAKVQPVLRAGFCNFVDEPAWCRLVLPEHPTVEVDLDVEAADEARYDAVVSCLFTPSPIAGLSP